MRGTFKWTTTSLLLSRRSGRRCRIEPAELCGGSWAAPRWRRTSPTVVCLGVLLEGALGDGGTSL